MSRSGFALIAVLWTIALIGAVTGAGIGAVRIGDRTTANRAGLLRGRWAAEACLAIAAARWGGERFRSADTVGLGRTTTCHWWLDDPTSRLNVNRVSREILGRFLARLSLAPDSAAAFLDAVMARRGQAPFDAITELAALAGFDGSILPFLTVDGPGTLNAASAESAVLLALPGMTTEAVDRLIGARTGGQPIGDIDALIGALSPAGQKALVSVYAELSLLLTFSPARFVLTAQGYVGSATPAPRATVELLVMPLPDRLAVLRRRIS